MLVPARFNGPRSSGNGGYSAGLVAALLREPVEVTLRSPVPLDRELAVIRQGDAVAVRHGATLVAEARPVADVGVELPAPVAPAEARAAMAHYRGLAGGEFSRCFVCGRDRDDSFGVFAGRVPGRDLVASTWTPPGWTAGDGGTVRGEFVWAVLDCPTFFAAHIDQELTLSVLARMTGEVLAPVRPGEEHVVMAWPIARDGRKREAGIALLTAAGAPCAVARALLIEPRST